MSSEYVVMSESASVCACDSFLGEFYFKTESCIYYTTFSECVCVCVCVCVHVRVLVCVCKFSGKLYCVQQARFTEYTVN